MRVNVGWKLKVGAYRLTIGCSTCKSSPQAAFDEWEHPPLNPLECGQNNCKAQITHFGIIPTWDYYCHTEPEVLTPAGSPVTRATYRRHYGRFRALLVQARKDAGLTQQELAMRLGRPQSFVSKTERGERRLDVIEFLEVAQALNLDVPRFLDTLGAF